MRADVIVIMAPGVEDALCFDVDAKMCALRHSSRSRPLKLSMKAFSTGLPGRMNSSRTSCAYAQASIARLTNSPPLSTVIAVGAPRRADDAASVPPRP